MDEEPELTWFARVSSSAQDKGSLVDQALWDSLCSSWKRGALRKGESSMVLSFLSPLTPPGLSSDSPLLWEALQDLPHWMHSLHSPISALISLECHCLWTSQWPPLDCESRSRLGSQHWVVIEEALWGRNDFRIAGGRHSSNPNFMEGCGVGAGRGHSTGTYPAPAHHGSEPILHHVEIARVSGTFKIWCKRRHAVSETIPV